MQELRGKTAVVTGAAAGIGFALAERFTREGMRVVLADIEEGALRAAEQRLAGAGADVLALVADVTSPEALRTLRDQALERFGAVHVVCANAGVAPSGPVVGTLADWRWVVEVNLMGVIHTLDAFVPGLVAQKEGHVVCTASVGGLRSAPLLGAYCATKHAVVALTESLYAELAATGVGVSLLCPGAVATGIFESERNRPAALGGRGAAADRVRRSFQDAIRGGIAPAEVAGCVVAAIQSERFYVLTQPEMSAMAKTRADDIAAGRNPTQGVS
jgi:NAD(P)-dependent dehydrogenase (short-subunit alcohol dehydrogenase family)